MRNRQHSLLDGRFTVPGEPLLTAVRGQLDRLAPAQHSREQAPVTARFPHGKPATGSPVMHLVGHRRLGMNSDGVSGERSSLTMLPKPSCRVSTWVEM
jgi:hypothetical protein